MINKVILVGNVGVDPEIRTTESGVKVARVRLATTERIFNRQTNESSELTEWHTITLWRGLADVADRYVRKGSQLYIEGRLRTREWTDKDNIKRYSTEILADDMKLLGRRGDNQQGQQGGFQQGASQGGFQQPTQPGGGYSQPSAPAYSQPSYAQPTQPTAAVPAPQEDPDDLPF